MLEARELLCERDERTLFSGLSFTLNAGEWVQITGSNGAGKTTLLRLLTGLSRPDAGEVLWQGQPLHQVRDSYHQNLLWIGHQPGIKTRLTALENLHFYHRDGDTAQCLEALAQAGLAGFEDIPVNQLSAGQQRRVALARLWLTRATLWIDPADGKHDHTGNCQPRYKPATDLIQPWWDRQLMQCFPHSFDTRLEQKSVIQRY